MNKGELVAELAAQTELSQKAAQEAVNKLIEIITDRLVKGDSVNLTGFGSFIVRERKARIAHNPRTRAEIQIPARKAPDFKPGKSLKDAVN